MEPPNRCARQFSVSLFVLLLRDPGRCPRIARAPTLSTNALKHSDAIRSFINVDIKVKWSDEIETEIVVKDYTRNINLDSEPKKSILKLTKRTQDHAYSHQAQQLKTEF